jgi:hypothetical protein
VIPYDGPLALIEITTIPTSTKKYKNSNKKQMKKPAAMLAGDRKRTDS